MWDLSDLASLWAVWAPFAKAASFAALIGGGKAIQFLYDAWRQKREDAEDDAKAKQLSDDAKEVSENRRLMDHRLQAECDRLTKQVEQYQQALNDTTAHSIRLYRLLLQRQAELISLHRQAGLPTPVFEDLYPATFKSREPESPPKS